MAWHRHDVSDCVDGARRGRCALSCRLRRTPQGHVTSGHVMSRAGPFPGREPEPVAIHQGKLQCRVAPLPAGRARRRAAARRPRRRRATAPTPAAARATPPPAPPRRPPGTPALAPVAASRDRAGRHACGSALAHVKEMWRRLCISAKQARDIPGWREGTRRSRTPTGPHLVYHLSGDGQGGRHVVGPEQRLPYLCATAGTAPRRWEVEQSRGMALCPRSGQRAA